MPEPPLGVEPTLISDPWQTGLLLLAVMLGLEFTVTVTLVVTLQEVILFVIVRLYVVVTTGDTSQEAALLVFPAPSSHK